MKLLAFSVMLTALAAACLRTVSASAAEATFELPLISQFGNIEMEIDVGVPVARVHSIQVSFSGSARSALWTWYYEGQQPDCAFPDSVPRSFGVSVHNGTAHARWSWLARPDGPFAVTDTLRFYDNSAGHMFTDGRATLYAGEGASDLEYMGRNGCAGTDDHYCDECAAGLLEFDSHPIVTVVFEPAVPNELGTWGTVKARYR